MRTPTPRGSERSLLNASVRWCRVRRRATGRAGRLPRLGRDRGYWGDGNGRGARVNVRTDAPRDRDTADRSLAVNGGAPVRPSAGFAVAVKRRAGGAAGNGQDMARVALGRLDLVFSGDASAVVDVTTRAPADGFQRTDVAATQRPAVTISGLGADAHAMVCSAYEEASIRYLEPALIQLTSELHLTAERYVS